MSYIEIPERGPLTLRIVWAHILTKHGRIWQLVVEENDDDYGWVMVCPLSEFPEKNPQLVDLLPSAREEELPPWA